MSELLVPKEVRDHLDKVEKDWVDFKKKRVQEDKEQSRKAQLSELSTRTATEQTSVIGFPPIWIPIPIWTIRKKPIEYMTTDPEWKEFVKLEQDKKRVKELKTIAAKAVAIAVLDGLPPAALRVWGFDGHVKFDTGRIDFVFPTHAPAPHERLGLMVSPRGIWWTTRPMTDERGRRFYRIFHPTVFASAFWAGGKAYYDYYFKIVETKASELLGNKARNPQARSIPKAPIGYTGKEQAELKKAFTTPNPSAPTDLTDTAALLKTLLPSPPPHSAMEAAVKAYKKTHTNLQVAKWKECPRGGCYLTGYVDIISPKATIRVTVKAVYIPSEDKFLGSPTVIEATAMPKVSVITADKLKAEKLREERSLDRQQLEKVDKEVIEKQKADRINSNTPKDSDTKSGESNEIKMSQAKLEKSKAETMKETKSKADNVKINPEKKTGPEQGPGPEK